MTSDLATTNILLGIMAAVSLVEALALIAVLGGAVLLYRRTIRLLEGIEHRQIAPAAARVAAILDDVKGVTGAVKEAADGAGAGVRWGLVWLLVKLGAAARRSA